MSNQKVLGLDLSATTLPDAIAAMVEAWYDAQNTEQDSVLSEYINQILNYPVEWRITSNRSITVTVGDIMQIRKNQSNRSKAAVALSNLGIFHKGKNAKTIELCSNKLSVLLGSKNQADSFYGYAVNLQDIKINTTTYYDIIVLPVSYFYSI
jgi:hypothetical protein